MQIHRFIFLLTTEFTKYAYMKISQFMKRVKKCALTCPPSFYVIRLVRRILVGNFRLDFGTSGELKCVRISYSQLFELQFFTRSQPYNADTYSSENLVSFCSFWRQKSCGRTSCHRRRLKNVSLFKVYFFSVAIFNFLSLLCKSNVIFTAVNRKFYDPWGRGSDVQIFLYHG